MHGIFGEKGPHLRLWSHSLASLDGLQANSPGEKIWTVVNDKLVKISCYMKLSIMFLH
jgi:hypothetical protein